MLIFIIFLIVLCDHLGFQCRKVYVAFYHFTLLFIFFYFQDLSENHPGERVSWLKTKGQKLLAFFCKISFSFSENAMAEERRQFIREIELMKEVGTHRNILSMLGFWTQSSPIMLIMEHVPNGDLLQWLRKRRQQVSVLYRTVPISSCSI